MFTDVLKADVFLLLVNYCRCLLVPVPPDATLSQTVYISHQSESSLESNLGPFGSAHEVSDVTHCIQGRYHVPYLAEVGMRGCLRPW